MKKSLLKKSLAWLILFVSVTACGTNSGEIFESDEGAINGYDPIAYFNESAAKKGLKQFSYEWNGALWYFTTEGNLKMFKENPEKFAPQFGGYCAYGTADGHGHKAPTAPDAWTIVDGKLYLNYSMDVMGLWRPKKEELIEKANSNWPTVKTME